MPSASLDFRPICGRFAFIFDAFMLKRAVEKANSKIAISRPPSRFHGVAFGLLLVCIFWMDKLIQCNDVQLNPGPPKTDTMRQTRLASGGRRMSTDQDSIQNSAAQSTSQTQEPTLVDLMSVLQTIREDVKVLRESHAEVKEKMLELQKEVIDLRKENEDLRVANENLNKKVDNLVRKTDDLEGRSKRNNLIFYGLPRKENESNADCETLLQELFTSKLGLPDAINLDRAHRLNAQSNSPIIARCVFYKQKISILKAKIKLKGTNVFIGEDFSILVRETRRKLTPFLKKAVSEGKKASLIYNYLLIEGKKYCLDDRDNLMPMK